LLTTREVKVMEIELEALEVQPYEVNLTGGGGCGSWSCGTSHEWMGNPWD
jgi:hypothetical protein